MSRRRRLLALVVALLVAAAVSGCVRLPRSGPVVESTSQGSPDQPPGIFIDPRPPQEGASASEVVTGFLDAMTATPIQTTVAKQFLSEDAQAAWQPERSTITYENASTPRGTLDVQVVLSGADQLDSRGAWQGSLPRSERVLDFPMTMEGGEWRIDEAPNALVVPETWFEQRFREVSLYFFDPTGTILVPEPVYVPRGEQLATTLIRGLLRGPEPGLRRVSRSFIPSGLGFGLSVPVSEDGVVDIALKGDAGPQTEQAVELMLAQFAWTLRQEPSIQALRISIGGQQVQLPGGISEFDVGQGAAYDPTGYESSSMLYALRRGRLVSGEPDTLAPVGGTLGHTPYAVRSVAVDLEGTRAAEVSDDGTTVLEGPVRESGKPVREVVSDANDLLRPAWDFSGRLWLVDRTPAGSRVFYLDKNGPTTLTVPGVSGRDVRAFLVSRDGSRLVAAVRTRSGDRIMVSRIRHGSDGRVLGAGRAESIAWEGAGRLRVRDLAWRTPTTLAVLHLLTGQLSQIRALPVDGSPLGSEGLATTLRGPVLSLVGSPAPDESLFALTGSALIDLTSSERGTASVASGVTSLGYVG